MKRTLYRQCLLVKQDGKSERRQVAYIPYKFAKRNSVIKIMDDNDEWEDGWLVACVYDTVSDVIDAKKSFRQHKRNTGDSLPKQGD